MNHSVSSSPGVGGWGEVGGAAAGTESGLEEVQGEVQGDLQERRWLSELRMRMSVGTAAAA